MGWVAIVFWVLTHAGELFSLIQTVLGLIHSLPHDKAQQVKFDASEAIKNNDKHRLKEILEKACEGVGCPSDLKKDE